MLLDLPPQLHTWNIKKKIFCNLDQNMQKIIIKIVTFINSLGLFTILLIQILDEKVIFIKKG